MSETILVIDDEPDILEILAARLEHIGQVEVETARSGEEGVTKYKQLVDSGSSPALVVMDLNLSGSSEDGAVIDRHRQGLNDKMDGVAATQKIMAMDPQAVIWGYTAWFNTDWSKEMEEAGAQKIVGRTISFKAFAEQVEQFLQS